MDEGISENDTSSYLQYLQLPPIGTPSTTYTEPTMLTDHSWNLDSSFHYYPNPWIYDCGGDVWISPQDEPQEGAGTFRKYVSLSDVNAFVAEADSAKHAALFQLPMPDSEDDDNVLCDSEYSTAAIRPSITSSSLKRERSFSSLSEDDSLDDFFEIEGYKPKQQRLVITVKKPPTQRNISSSLARQRLLDDYDDDYDEEEQEDDSDYQVRKRYLVK
ncbi:hypothetical protein DFQ28_006661 [Apophysomyces sp. BC1034]|nr:hypothetical protein DFQ28_006661 [Apophysomyces sp. BC1034]